MKVIFRLLFVFIFIFSAIYVFRHQKYSKRIEIINGYAENFSVNKGDDLGFYLNPDLEHKKGIVCIYNANNTIVDSLLLDLKFEQQNDDTLMFENGYGYKNKYVYNTSKLKSGLYFIGNIIPFIVKQPELKNSITIVFPISNFLAFSNVGGKSFSNSNSSHGIAATKLSLNRNPYLSNNPRGFIHWVDSIYANKNVNYIADLDLEDKTTFDRTKLLMLFGNSTFWTIKQSTNFFNYIENGGNALAICSRLMNNEMVINKVSQRIEVEKKLESEVSRLYNEHFREINPFWQLVGCDYRISYVVKELINSNGGYRITQPKHPIFKNVDSDFVDIENSYGNAIAVETIYFKEYPIADNRDLKFFKNEILAFDYFKLYDRQSITGIFQLQRTPQSGTMLIIGSEKWVYDENLSRPIISNITANCINYLIDF